MHSIHNSSPLATNTPHLTYPLLLTSPTTPRRRIESPNNPKTDIDYLPNEYPTACERLEDG